MRRQALLLASVVALSLLGPPPALGAGVDVTVDDAGLRFMPDRVTRSSGVGITWHKSGGFHNVSSVDGMFRSGAPTSSAFTFTRTFSGGTFRYVCEVHPSQMRGTVRVRPRARAAPSGAPFSLRWASPATDTGSAFTVQYRVADGRWRTWRQRTSSRAAVFGRNAVPVRVRPGTLYAFRVKSLLADASSRFSPVRRFRP